MKKPRPKTIVYPKNKVSPQKVAKEETESSSPKEQSHTRREEKFFHLPLPLRIPRDKEDSIRVKKESILEASLFSRSSPVRGGHRNPSSLLPPP